AWVRGRQRNQRYAETAEVVTQRWDGAKDGPPNARFLQVHRQLEDQVARNAGSGSGEIAHFDNGGRHDAFVRRCRKHYIDGVVKISLEKQRFRSGSAQTACSDERAMVAKTHEHREKLSQAGTIGAQEACGNKTFNFGAFMRRRTGEYPSAR
ncbi:MAG TPA: hypothetical protein VJ834_06130, partial [Burkholderiales bacterium]|nr:hypothetical protein [Burkholderiales bacterium]